MTRTHPSGLSRRAFCLCCIASSGFAATSGLTPRQAFAEARGLVSLIKDSAATSPIVVHKLRHNVSVLEGSGGNIAVLTGPDGKVMVDAGIGVSRPQLMKALADLGPEPITTLINTHWHFDHTDGNTWLNSVGAKIIAQDNTRKYLSEVQRVEDWDYNFLPRHRRNADAKPSPTRSISSSTANPLNLKHYSPGPYRQRHFRDLRRGEHRACGRYVLERRLPVYRLFNRRQHRRHDRRLRRQSRGGDRHKSSSPDTVSRSATSPSSRSFATCWSGCGRTSRRSSGRDDPRRNGRREADRRL